MSNKKTMFFAVIIALAVIVATVAPTSQQGQVQGKFKLAINGDTLNGTAVGTGTAFRINDNLGFLSLFYQVTAGTSTPHYQLRVYTSPDNVTYSGTGVLATATADETSTAFTHVSVSIPLTNWVRVDMEGVTANATNTTYVLWEGNQ